MNIKQYVDRLLQYIDSGRFFRTPLRVLYTLFGACAFLPALVLLVGLVGKEARYALSILNYLGGWSKAVVYFALFLIFVYLLLLGFFGLYYWLNRKKDLYNTVRIGDKIKALPTIAHLIRCLGESYAILSFLATLGVYIIAYVLLLFTGFKPLGVTDPEGFFKVFLIGLLGIPGMAIGLFLQSYLVILLTHGASELLLIKTSIANNVSDLGDIQRATVMPEKEEDDAPHTNVETEQPESHSPASQEMTSDQLNPTKEQ